MNNKARLKIEKAIREALGIYSPQMKNSQICTEIIIEHLFRKDIAIYVREYLSDILEDENETTS